MSFVAIRHCLDLPQNKWARNYNEAPLAKEAMPAKVSNLLSATRPNSGAQPIDRSRGPETKCPLGFPPYVL